MKVGGTVTNMDNYKTQCNLRCPAQNVFVSGESWIPLRCQVLALIRLNKTAKYTSGRLTQIVSCDVNVLRLCGLSLIILTLNCKCLLVQPKIYTAIISKSVI